MLIAMNTSNFQYWYMYFLLPRYDEKDHNRKQKKLDTSNPFPEKCLCGTSVLQKSDRQSMRHKVCTNTG